MDSGDWVRLNCEKCTEGCKFRQTNGKTYSVDGKKFKIYRKHPYSNLVKRLYNETFWDLRGPHGIFTCRESGIEEL